MPFFQEFQMYQKGTSLCDTIEILDQSRQIPRIETLQSNHSWSIPGLVTEVQAQSFSH